MRDQGELSNERQILNRKDFLYIVIMLTTYFLYAIVRDNYWNALVMPMIFGFVWVGFVKQKFSIAVGLVAIYTMIALSLISAGYMTPYTLTNLLIALSIVSVGRGVFIFSWGKAIAIVGFLFVSVFLFYLFDVFDKYTYLTLTISGGFSLLGKYLLPPPFVQSDNN